MAVVQISRIQLRRGKAKAGTGIPQLASGEMAWALDTQQLYIGNGSVAEGAPAVGNTKILTENDLNGRGNILDTIKHIYKDKEGEIVQTGATAASPVSRSLQDRLDDRVTLADFVDPLSWGTVDYDYTEDLQRAIDQLFRNVAAPSYDPAADSIETRVILELPAGEFKITGTIYIPSYANIVGAGLDKTVLKYTGTSTAMEFVKDNDGNTLQYGNQPRYVRLEGITVRAATLAGTVVKLESVRDSTFEDIRLEGVTTGVFVSGSKAIALNVFSSVVTCERNIFNNVQIEGFQTGIYSPYDIARNTFNNMFINYVNDAVIFGIKLVGSTTQLQEIIGQTVGEQYGPSNNVFSNSVFGDAREGIKRYAMFTGRGSNNTINDSRFINVGNTGSGVSSPVYPQVYFTAPGNTIKNVTSDRSVALTDPLVPGPYIPEVAGINSYDLVGSTYAKIRGASVSDETAFKLPLPSDPSGTPRGKGTFTIKYVYRALADGDNFVRQGTIHVAVDADNNLVQLSDEYNFSGNGNNELILDFKAVLIDATDAEYTNPIIQTAASLAIKYKNVPVNGTLYYSYSSAAYDTGIVVN